VKSDEHWMAQAHLLAREAFDANEVPIGAVVVLDDEIIGQGYNQTLKLTDPSAHAEIVAIRDAAQKLGNHRLVGANLYVTIEPCSMCAGALVHARIKRLVYGAKELKSGAVESTIAVLANPSLNHHVEVHGGVGSDAASELMSNFFRAKRKK
jgi:tRNA(adenine34) deaminase